VHICRWWHPRARHCLHTLGLGCLGLCC
jgi:hypothetical protein